MLTIWNSISLDKGIDLFMTILGSFIADKKYDRYFENFQDVTKIFLSFWKITAWTYF